MKLDLLTRYFGKEYDEAPRAKKFDVDEILRITISNIGWPYTPASVVAEAKFMWDSTNGAANLDAIEKPLKWWNGIVKHSRWFKVAMGYAPNPRYRPR